MNYSDQWQFGFAVVIGGLQESGLDFQPIEGFVFVIFRGAERVLLPGIIEVRDLSSRRFIVPEPEFLWSGSSVAGERRSAFTARRG